MCDPEKNEEKGKTGVPGYSLRPKRPGRRATGKIDALSPYGHPGPGSQQQDGAWNEESEAEEIDDDDYKESTDSEAGMCGDAPERASSETETIDYR